MEKTHEEMILERAKISDLKSELTHEEMILERAKLSDSKSELETYKKIAENLANTLSKEIFNKLGIKPRIEDLIEVARKEVEKNANN